MDSFLIIKMYRLPLLIKRCNLSIAFLFVDTIVFNLKFHWLKFHWLNSFTTLQLKLTEILVTSALFCPQKDRLNRDVLAIYLSHIVEIFNIKIIYLTLI